MFNQKIWSENNKDKISKYNKKYREKNYDKIRTYQKEWNKNNRDKINEYQRGYCLRNPNKRKASKNRWNNNNCDRIREYEKEYYKSNCDHIKIIQKEWCKKHPDYFSKWSNKHPDKVKEFYRNYYKKGKMNNSFIVKKRLRCLLRQAFREYSKGGKLWKSEKYGIDFEAIMSHIGKIPGKDWQIHHIKPLYYFNFDNPKEVKLAFAPKNHMWLPTKENRRIGNKLE